MADVARRAGVHQTTVSRALRNDHRLPAATRERIQQIAQEAGYRPNPLVSALIATRRARHPPKVSATIALVARHVLGETGQLHFAGARAAAGQLGYSLETFVLGQDGLNDRRLNEILLARNIHGIVIAPLLEAHGQFDLEWDRFCISVIEYTFTSPQFDRVVSDNYGGMRLILQECRRRELRRVGLVLSQIAHDRTERLYGAAFWGEQKAEPYFPAITPLILPRWDEAVFQRWFRQHRPEVLVTSNALLGDIQAWCDARKLAYGRDIHIANVNTFPAGPVAGIVQNHHAIGATAVRMVIEKISVNDRGVPADRHTTLIPGKWKEGATFRPRS